MPPNLKVGDKCFESVVTWSGSTINTIKSLKDFSTRHPVDQRFFELNTKYFRISLIDRQANYLVVLTREIEDHILFS